MEKVVLVVLFFCKYVIMGCFLILYYMEKLEYEDICEYCFYFCLCFGVFCKWQGFLEVVMFYFMYVYKSIIIFQGEDIVFLVIDINLLGVVDWVMMQLCFGYYFMLVLEK